VRHRRAVSTASADVCAARFAGLSSAAAITAQNDFKNFMTASHPAGLHHGCDQTTTR